MKNSFPHSMFPTPASALARDQAERPRARLNRWLKTRTGNFLMNPRGWILFAAREWP